MSQNSIATALGGIILSMAVSVGAPALAAPDGQRTEVRFGDLDLSTDAGTKALNHRIKFAAKQVCRYGAERDMKMAAKAESCMKVAMESASPQVELALAKARNGDAQTASGIELNAPTRTLN